MLLFIFNVEFILWRSLACHNYHFIWMDEHMAITHSPPQRGRQTPAKRAGGLGQKRGNS
uniref:Uncharacterized protein n=1 Tax=Anguilla anguilla TaxID=7936 RepID=A0A0E9VH46_ANGAN